MQLVVPSMDRIVREGTFDAWSWCASDTIEWRMPHAGPLDVRGSIDGDNPPDLVFVMRSRVEFLPRELARLHAFGYGLGEEECLAPWAIDDATDLLYAHRVRPRDVFWLAAPSLPALVWGLHDWVHFHNHGPFEDPPTTELQCDLVALAWLRGNAARIGIEDATLARVATELAALSARRFAEAGREPPFDLPDAFARDYRELVSDVPTSSA